MNKNIIELNDNQYAISDEFDNIRIITTKKLNDNTWIEEIFIKENDIEQLEFELEKNQETLKDIKNKTIQGEIMNIFIYIFLIKLYLHIPITTTVHLIILGHVYIILKGINCYTFETRLNRFLKKRKAQKNVKEIEPYLLNLHNELEQLKIDLKYIELTKITVEEKNRHNNNYIFQYIPKNTTDTNSMKEKNTLRLIKKKT